MIYKPFISFNDRNTLEEALGFKNGCIISAPHGKQANGRKLKNEIDALPIVGRSPITAAPFIEQQQVDQFRTEQQLNELEQEQRLNQLQEEPTPVRQQPLDQLQNEMQLNQLHNEQQLHQLEQQQYFNQLQQQVDPFELQQQLDQLRNEQQLRSVIFLGTEDRQFSCRVDLFAGWNFNFRRENMIPFSSVPELSLC